MAGGFFFFFYRGEFIISSEKIQLNKSILYI